MEWGVLRVHVPPVQDLKCPLVVLQCDEGDGDVLEKKLDIRYLPYLLDFFFMKKVTRACRLVGIQLKGSASE